ncbi:MAG: hypothetical protein QM698_01460 [Micropepsaceae bacterium]
MRQAILLAALGLAACGSAETPAAATAVDQPMPGTSSATTEVRLFSIDNLTAACTDGVLKLQVGASANSGGWGEPHLKRLSLEKGRVSYEVIALPPEGPAVTMMVQMFMLTHDDKDAAGIAEVRVIAASNEMTATVAGCPAGAR